MSILLDLKDWLTLQAVAKHLTSRVGGGVTERDVMEWAFSRRLRLCVRITCPVAVATGEMRVVKPGERWVPMVPCTGPECYALVNDPDYCFEEPVTEDMVGVFDFPLEGKNLRYAESWYQVLGGRHEPTWGLGEGNFIRLPTGEDRYLEGGTSWGGATLVVRPADLTAFVALLPDVAPPAQLAVETPAQRRERIVAYVNGVYAVGKSKESAFGELAVIEACSVANIKRIYRAK